MNCIILEGIMLYLFLIMVVLLIALSLVSLVSAVLADKRNYVLVKLLVRENGRVNSLIKENFLLKIKCGEFEVNDE